MIEVIDLSWLISPDLEVEHEKVGTYADPPTIFDKYLDDYNERGYIITRLDMGAHVGTHCDFPIHVLANGGSIADFSVSTFVGWAAIMDFYGQGPITAQMLHVHEKRIAGVPDVIPVLLHGKTDYLSPEARGEIIKWRPKIIMLGEGCNIDDRYEDTHAFLNANIPMIMKPNNAMVQKIRNGDLLVAEPLNMQGLEASPIRLVAIRGLPGQHTQLTLKSHSWMEKLLRRF